MSISAPKPELANELRYALDVMEENSHLGLDDEAANRLRKILLRRIKQAEIDFSGRPAEPVRFPAEEKAFA
jgi:hypothetical protein